MESKLMERLTLFQLLLERISHYVEVITAPVRVIDLFKKEVFTAKTTDLVKSIIPQMKEKNYTAVPIYDAQ